MIRTFLSHDVIEVLLASHVRFKLFHIKLNWLVSCLTRVLLNWVLLACVLSKWWVHWWLMQNWFILNEWLVKLMSISRLNLRMRYFKLKFFILFHVMISLLINCLIINVLFIWLFIYYDVWLLLLLREHVSCIEHWATLINVIRDKCNSYSK